MKEVLDLEEEIIEKNEARLMAEKYGLIYCSDLSDGIKRYKKGRGFFYSYSTGEPVVDDQTLQRIKKLILPPAWKDVWICLQENGHLQATGIDAKGRKQYRYHEKWNLIRNEFKFTRLCRFGEKLSEIRLQVEKDLARQGLTFRKVVALVISVMERTFIRIGNSSYEKLYGSYGLTTLRDKHVQFSGDQALFAFKGKKGIFHTISLRSKRLVRLLKRCKDIPGQELFQYYDDKGKRRQVEANAVNSYLKEVTGEDFTAKDFRTWAGSLNALTAFKEIGLFKTLKEAKRNIVKAIDYVSAKLGNTRSTCKKYYIHPAILEKYEKDSLKQYLQELENLEEPDGKTGLTKEEMVLMKLLKESV